MTFRKCLFLISSLLLAGSVARAGSLSPGLEALLAQKQHQEQVTVLVVLREQADVRTIDRNLRGAKATLPQRHRQVTESLRSVAESSQRGLLAHLEARRNAGAVRSFRPYWLINAVAVTATPGEIRALALRPEVDIIEPDLEVELIAPAPGRNDLLVPADTLVIGVTPGVAAVNAPRVWHELGVDGAGALVGVIDTGVDSRHPTLADRWRGNFAPAEECWLDAAGVGVPEFPIDLGRNGHGTHVMGTLTGVAGGDTIGVAPGARWIATNAVDTGIEELDGAVLASLQFMTDPDGDPATTDDVPDVVQNSWGVSEAFDGFFDCDSRWWDAIDNCEAAGVVLVWAAGNEGPYNSTLRSPADRASSPTNCFSVGSTQTYAPYVISDFSSRGPSTCGGPYAVKPEVVAPGNDILSARAGGGYRYLSGTSMSGPHVAGVVALMRSANPDAGVAAIKEILMETAFDLGPWGQDNTYGQGFVDAYAAVLAVMEDVGWVEGTVTDAATGSPLAGAAVIGNADVLATTDAAGFYRFNLPAGTRLLTVSKFGYYDAFTAATIPARGTTTADATLTSRPRATISGRVLDPAGEPLSGAVVAVVDVAVDPAITDATGFYALHLPFGEGVLYELRAAYEGLGYRYWTVELFADRTVDFALPPLVWEDFESGGFQEFPWVSGGDAAWFIDPDRSYSGSYSARSGSIWNYGESFLSLDFYVSGTSDLTFRFKVSSEAGFDFLSFLLDGQVVESWSGEVDWTPFTVEVPYGHHNFKWVYARDPAFFEGSDAAWIDLVEFPTTGPLLTPRLGLDLTTVPATAPAGGSAGRTFTIASEGDLVLEYAISVGEVLNQTGPRPPLAVVTPAAGSLAPGSSDEIAVAFNAASFEPGVYVAVMTVTSNDPADSLRTIPLIMTVTDVSAVGDDVLHDRVVFAGAMPNPFNPRTHLEFVLPSEENISLRVYDVSGRLVRDLATGTFAAGRHRILWNGQDDAGRQAASGVYYARLAAGGESRIRMMTLVR